VCLPFTASEHVVLASQSHTVPLGSLPDSSSLQLLLLQPTHSPPVSSEQMSAALWPLPSSPALPTLPIPLPPVFLTSQDHACPSGHDTSGQAAEAGLGDAEVSSEQQASTWAQAPRQQGGAVLVLPCAPPLPPAQLKHQKKPSHTAGLQQHSVGSSAEVSSTQVAAGNMHSHESGLGPPALAAGLPRPPLSEDSPSARAAAGGGPLGRRGLNQRASEQLVGGWKQSRFYYMPYNG
jgi:hypothetical protein